MKQTEFEKQWLDSFAPQITKKQYEDCYVNEFLWHVFSYQLVANPDVLTGDEAIKAYDNLDKDGAIYIQICNNGNEAQSAPIPEKLKRSKSVIKQQEVYIMSKD